MRLGRNDPCPCGSGWKHKKCCLARAEAASREARAAARARDRVLAKLYHFGFGSEFDRVHDAAADLFWADWLEKVPDDEVEELVGSPEAGAGFAAWFLLDLDVAAAGQTVVDLFLERERGRLAPAERAFLERMRETALGLYEPVAVRPDERLDLVDLWTGERVRVRERLASRQLVRWDLLGARVLCEEGGEAVLEVGLHLYPTEAKGEILATLRRRRRAFARARPGADDRASFKRAAALFHHFWLDRVVFPPVPEVRTREGDPIVFAKSVFDVRDRARLAAALDRLPELASVDAGAYDRIDEAQPLPRTLGHLRLRGRRLVVETMSRERDERGRRLLEAAAPLEVEREALREVTEAYYRKWLDEPLPGLRHRSPRDAARPKRLRPRVVELLKTLENRRLGGETSGPPPASPWSAARPAAPLTFRLSRGDRFP